MTCLLFTHIYSSCDYSFDLDAIVAEVHFWTMRRVLGSAYDDKAHGIWAKIFSRFLKVMVPIAVRHEIHTAGMI